MGMHSALEDRFAHLVLFDTETTGIDPEREEIIEIGAVSVSEGGEDGSFNALIRLSKGRTLPPFITQLTGITPEALAAEGIEKAEAAVDEKKAQELAEKLKKNRFTLTDYLDQLNSMKNMGSLQELAGMVPGLDAKALAGAKIDEKAMAHTEAIILSMTPAERENPSILNSSRKRRIAAGAGVGVVDINRLLKQFEMMQTMARQLSGKKMKRFQRGGGKMPFGF